MRISSFICILIFTFSSCVQTEDNTFDFQVPDAYNFTRNGENTVDFSQQTIVLGKASELNDELLNIDITTDDLLALYTNENAAGEEIMPFKNPALNVNSPSLKSLTASSIESNENNTMISSLAQDLFDKWIIAQHDKVLKHQNQVAENGAAGQIADGSNVRYVSAQGVEYNQLVTKGLIGALFLDQIINHYLSPEVLDKGEYRNHNDGGVLEEAKPYTAMEHAWDSAYGFLFGESQDPTNPLADLGTGDFLNKYLGRVESDEDFRGIAQEIFDAFKVGRAAIQGKDYEVRDQQAQIIEDQLSQIIGIRAVYYLESGKRNLRNGQQYYGSAFHDLSEGLGFIYSLLFVKHGNEFLFNQKEVEGFIEMLLADNGFWDINPKTLDSVSQTIAEKFDFTIDQVIN